MIKRAITALCTSRPHNQFRLFNNGQEHAIDSNDFKERIIDPLSIILFTDDYLSLLKTAQDALLEGLDFSKINFKMQNSQLDQDLSSLSGSAPRKLFKSFPDYLRLLTLMTIRDSSFMVMFKLADLKGADSTW